MLSDAEIGAMRREVAASLPDTATIQRWNGQWNQWQAVGTAPCRTMPRRSVTRDVNGDLQGITLWHILLPWNADVRIGDRLDVDDTTYAVTGSDAGRSEAVGLLVQCTRVT